MKKRKSFNQLVVILLIFCIILNCMPISTRAESSVIIINTKEEWLAFAEQCHTDSYSIGLQVELTQSIDLSGESNVSVPIFCGRLQGNGYTISGVEIDTQADTQGLFRVVSEEAVIQNLNVSVNVSGSEESSIVGALCGKNQGTIESCTGSGYVSAYENVGGIAGINEHGGIIQACTSSVKIEGTFKVGGITGTNNGSISDCGNSGNINTSANESAINVGGITGVNESTIIDCNNTGEIGYLHTGYNVGGVSGISRGFIRNCTNYGIVSGRRDVGGIVGQMEPHFKLEYGQNAMELLDNNVSGFSQALDKATESIQTAVSNGTSDLNSILSQLTSFSQELSDDITILFSNMTWTIDVESYLDEISNEIQYIKNNLPNASDGSVLIQEIEELLKQFDENSPSSWPDLLQQLMEQLGRLSTQLEDYTWIGESLNRISEILGNLFSVIIDGFQDFGNESTDVLESASARLSEIATSTSTYLDQTSEDISQVRESVSQVADAISGLQSSVDEVLEGKTDEMVDVSEQVSSQDDGMIVSSQNGGIISADYNVGGVVGNLSMELTLDQEAESLPSVDDLLFTDTTTFVRATIYTCQNTADIYSKYDYTGGILGYGSRGALLSCQNSGNISAGRNVVGGIAGYFRGKIQESYSISFLDGKSYIGGIAGDAKQIESCTAIPEIKADGAYIGAIAGTNLDSGQNNLFVSNSLGGIDGISYTGIAEPISYEDLIQKEGIPDCFRTLSVRFEIEGVLLKEVSVSFGQGISELPVVEQENGMFWHWDDFSLESIRYNQTIDGEWKNLITTISTGEVTPLFFVEGEFDATVQLDVKNISTGKSLDSSGKTSIYASYSLCVTGNNAEKLTIRYQTDIDGELYQINNDMKTSLSYDRDGRYIVFELDNGGSFYYEFNEYTDLGGYILIVVGILLLFSICCILYYVKKSRRIRQKKYEDSPM